MAASSVFIGSSSEGLDFARAARRLLEKDAEVTLWNEEFFGLGSTFIEALIEQVPRFDFAILILTPDDLSASRDVDALSPRDNVIFELGLFMGSLGRARTFVVHQAHPTLKVPSDLAGVVTAQFDWPRGDRNHASAMGGACDRIRPRIRDLGVSVRKVARDIEAINLRQDDQDKELSNQKTQIASLQLALRGIITRYELDKLHGLTGECPFLVHYSPELISELQHLRAMGLVQNYEGKGLRGITERYSDRHDDFDLREHFYITDHGTEYLRVRRELEALAAAP